MEKDWAAGLKTEFNFTKCMATSDMEWRKCRDVSAGFIVAMTFIFIGIAILWAILAAFQARVRAHADALEVQAYKEMSVLPRVPTKKILNDKLTRNGTEIV